MIHTKRPKVISFVLTFLFFINVSFAENLSINAAPSADCLFSFSEMELTTTSSSVNLFLMCDPPPDCDDGNCNTIDTHDPITCECINTQFPPPNCDDGDCLTIDTYDPVTCECINTLNPPDCDDQNCNTTDFYDATTCSCVNIQNPPPDCDDQNCNTIDTYDPATCSCVNIQDPNFPLDCDDQDCSTIDSYDALTCSCVYTLDPNLPLICNDNNPFTTDTYDPQTCQCIFTPQNCNEPANPQVTVEEGDVYVEDPCFGVILTSPSGFCFRLRVDDNGGLITEPVACP